MKKVLILLAIFLSFLCATASAQEVTATTEVTTPQPAPPAKQRFDIGVGYWYTDGALDYYAYASKDDVYGGLLYKKGDKISELNNDLDAGLFIVNAEAWIWWRLYVDGFIGWGDFDGEHRDSDWFPQYRSDLMQYSKSDAKGDVRTWNVNGYLRVIEEPEDKGYLDLAIGYFYYRDNIKHLKNSTITIYNWEPVNIPLTGHDSSDKYTFDGLRLGIRGKIRLHNRVAIKASGGICPWLNMDNRKFWNLREDYGPPPGMKAKIEADGTAFDLNVGLEFKLMKNLFIEAGYKYINLDTDKGDDKRTWLSGVSATFKDAGEARGHRGGVYAMGRLKF